MVDTEVQQLPIPQVLIDQMKDTPQNPRYHAEGSVYNHTQLVLTQFLDHHGQFNLSARDYQALYWSAIVHDLGKPQVTAWVQGRWSARGHEAAGVSIARDLLLQQPDIDTAQRQRILSIVKYHSAPLQMGLRGVSIDQYKRLATRVDLRLLGQFVWFDLHGRICVDQDKVFGIIDHFLSVIVPQVEYELGTFGDIQQAYTSARYQKKNALWHALQQEKSDLVQKLLHRPQQGESPRPVFQVVVPVGPPHIGKSAYLQQRFPDYRFFTFTLPVTNADDPHVRLNHMRTARHFVSVFGKEGKNLVIEGPWIEDAYRNELLAFIRQQGGAIHLLNFDSKIADLQTLPGTDDQAETLRIYQQQQLLHPWEGHVVEIVDHWT
ncbi:MAG: HD domain-containing protein [Bacteroidia bacterium]|nr:HD domain-containing protein [Bacteroidia bacterium]